MIVFSKPFGKIVCSVKKLSFFQGDTIVQEEWYALPL